jgi:GT2 family glycosyltransferase
MNIHIIKPYSIEKNLGKAYNESMRLIPDEDWACIMDYDTMFLTPDCGKILHEYVKGYSFAGMLTCFTNRIHPLSEQLYEQHVSANADINYHTEIAERVKKKLYTVTVLSGPVSGFLMLISKKTWNEIKFSETSLCLGVDTDYYHRLKVADKAILRMDGLYIWHTYRLKNGIKDKTHLV